MSNQYNEISENILNEITKCILSVNTKETKKLCSEIIKEKKVFLIGVGRVNLSLQCFGKRLAHLGINVEIIGSITEKPATNKDLLIIASGSGESIIPLNIAKKAKIYKTRIGLITSVQKSSIKKLANFSVTLKTPTKKVKHGKIQNQSLSDKASKVESVQPMSSLFDQTLHIYGDIVSMIILEKMQINKDDIWKYHANLE